MSDLLPIHDDMNELIDKYYNFLSGLITLIEDAYSDGARDTLNLFDEHQLDMNIRRLAVFIEKFQDITPMNREPDYAGVMISALHDTVGALNRGKVKDAYEALSDFMADMHLMIDEYNLDI